MHSAPRALTKDPTVKFVVVQISLILLLWGDTSCWAEPLSVNSVPLNVDIGTQIAGSGGDLVYRGGVELSSEDPRFGGFSGLLVTHNGNKLLAISDRGWWLQGDLFYNESGDLVGVQHVEILPMRPLEAGPNFTLDAEAVVQTGDGELVVAYAMSVHKSQGAEFGGVVMRLTTQHYMMLQRNLLYTAITRARELVVLVGTKQAMAMAVRNNQVALRYTTLAERIRVGIIDEPTQVALL